MAEIYPQLKIIVNRLVNGGIIPRKYRAKLLEDISEAFRQQIKKRYKYLVGKWRGRVRSKSTKTGSFVSNKAVVRYINQDE